MTESLQDGFVGHFPATVDSKNRIKLPAHFLNVYNDLYGAEGRTLYSCISLDRNIDLFPISEWSRHIKQLEANSIFNVESRKIYTVVRGSTTRADLDAQGRLKLSPTLLKYGNISKNVVVCGFSTKLELWAADAWENFFENAMEEFLATQSQLYEQAQQQSVGAQPLPPRKP